MDILGQKTYQDKIPAEIKHFAKTVESGYESIAKHVPDAEFARIGRREFSNEDLSEFCRRKKRDKQQIHKSSICYVECVKKKSENDYAMVTIETQSEGAFTLRADNFLLDDQMDLIYEGLRDDCALHFTYDYILSDGRFVEGRIVSVERVKTAL
ncbi:hypothetical protein ACK3ZW_00010 [Aeromonas caviae]